MGALLDFVAGLKKVAGDSAYTDEFDAWQPKSSYQDLELTNKGYGSTQWVGPEVKAIHAKVKAPPDSPMQEFFEDIAKRVWQKAGHTQGLQWRQFLALTRQPNAAPLPPLTAFAAPTLGATTPPMRGLPPPPKPLPGLPGLGPRPALVSPTAVDDIVQQTIKGQAKMPGSAVSDPNYLTAVAKDWKMMVDLERIYAYAFRGDGRSPDLTKKADGFKPPSTRTDEAYLGGVVYKVFMSYMNRRFGTDPKSLSSGDFLSIVKQKATGPVARILWYEYTIWRAMEQAEEFHLGRMLADEALKGYISTSRAVSVAKGFACKRDSREGWVYVVLVEGGIVVPEKTKHAWTAIFGEQEIAYPGFLSWEKIYGFRQARDNRFITNQPLYLRKRFRKDDSDAFMKCYDLLSGKPQN